MRRTLVVFILFSMIFASCGAETKKSSPDTSSEASLQPGAPVNSPPPVNTEDRSFAGLDTLGIKQVAITGLAASDGQSKRHLYNDPGFISEICSLFGNQSYNAMPDALNSDYESYKIEFLGDKGENLLNLTVGSTEVVFDKPVVLGEKKFEAGVTYDAGVWLSEYVAEFYKGNVISPSNTISSGTVKVPVSDFTAQIINKGNRIVNKYETLPNLYSFINTSLSGKDFEITGSRRIFGYEGMTDAYDEKWNGSECISVQYYLDYNNPYQRINDDKEYGELARMSSFILSRNPDGGNSYELLTDGLILDVKVDGEFDSEFRKIFDEDGTIRKELSPDEINSLFSLKKPYFMEYICRNLGLDDWNGREDDVLTAETMKLSGGKPYNVLKLSNYYQTRLLIFKDQGAGAWKFIDYVDFSDYVTGADIHPVEAAGHSWIVGNDCKGRGTGELRLYQDWYEVGDQGKKLVLSFPYAEYFAPPWGGSDITADEIKTVDGDPFSVNVDYNVKMNYYIDIDVADEYGQVGVAGTKSVKFTWNEAAGKFVSDYPIDDSGLMMITPVCNEITEKCGKLLSKYYDRILEDIRNLKNEENGDTKRFKAYGIEYFLSDCPDSEEKSGAMKVLKDTCPELVRTDLSLLPSE